MDTQQECTAGGGLEPFLSEVPPTAVPVDLKLSFIKTCHLPNVCIFIAYTWQSAFVDNKEATK